MKAKQLVFPSKMQVEIEEVEISDRPGEGEVLVEHAYGLISPGTELAMFTESHVGFKDPDFQYAKYPFHPGYTAVGRVLTLGDGVEDLAEGDLVFTRGRHVSHTVCSAEGAYKLRDGVPLEHAPFAMMAQIAFTSVRLAELRFGSDVAVFGQGLVGNFAAQLILCAGARHVIGIDTVAHRLTIAAECGTPHHVNPEIDDLDASIDEITGGVGCQVVVEATGNPSVAVSAIRVAAQMGKVVLLGSPRGSAEIDLYMDIHRTGVSVIGAHASRQYDAVRYGDPDGQNLMLDFIAQRRLCIGPLHTHTLPATDADIAYRGLLEEKESFLGVLLDLTQW